MLFSGGALVILVLFGGVAARVLSRIRDLENRPVTRVPHPFDADPLWDNIGRLETRVHEQTLAIDEGIQRVGRAEARVAEAVRRAKRRADEAGYVDPGIEAEVAGLHDGDGGGGAEGTVPVLYEGVASDVGEASSIRGVTVEQLQRARGW